MFKTYLRIKRLQRYEEFSIPANFSAIFSLKSAFTYFLVSVASSTRISLPEE